MIFRKALRSKSQVRARRRARLILAGVVGGSLVAAFVFFAWLANRDEFLISTIAVRGVSPATEKKILASAEAILSENYFFLFPKKNGILYPREEITEALLNTLPELASVSIVARRPFTTLAIAGVMREPAYLWCGEVETQENKHCYSVDREGVVFEETLLSPDGVPLFSSTSVVVWYGKPVSSVRENNRAAHPLGKRVLPQSEFEEAVAFKNSLDTVRLETRSVHLEENGDWEFTLMGGTSVLVRRDGDLPKAFENLSAALSAGELKDIPPAEFSQRLDYIDLRFDRRVFYKER